MKRLLTLTGCLIAFSSYALNGAHFTISRVSAPYFVVDGNQPTILTKAYVGFEVTNNSNSGTTYTNLLFSVTSITTNTVGQNYSIVAPTSNQVLIGTLAPGQSKVCYFYVSYPASTTPIATFNVRLSDNTASDKTQAFSIHNRSSISANAGGLTQQTFTNQDQIGGVIYDDVVYTVGNVQNGDESDFQISISSLFDPTKVTLLGTQITASTVPGIAVGSTDSLYYITGNGSVGASITMRWTFKIVATNFTAYFLPVAGSTSGGTNYKYAINTSLGANGTSVTITGGSTPLSISKTSSKATYYTCETAVFTLTVTNPSSYGVSVDSLVDNLPAGFTYSAIDAASGIPSSSLSSVPATGATGTIKFKGGVYTGGNNSIYIPPNSSINIKYTATAPCVATSTINTSVSGYIGSTSFATANNSVNVVWGLPVKWNSFTAVRTGAGVDLVWKTDNEQNTRDYVAERSTEGLTWTAIGSVPAAGYSSSLQIYRLTDPNPENGVVNYYRIRQNDLDDKAEYSKVVSVFVKATETGITLYPNPVLNGKLNIRLSAATTISLYNEQGVMVFRKAYLAGTHQIDMSRMVKGVYVIRTDKESRTIMVK